MNRNFIIILFLFTVWTVELSAQEHEDHHTFFWENSVTVSLRSTINNEIEPLGLNGRFYYNVPENICFGPNFC